MQERWGKLSWKTSGNGRYGMILKVGFSCRLGLWFEKQNCSLWWLLHAFALLRTLCTPRSVRLWYGAAAFSNAGLLVVPLIPSVQAVAAAMFAAPICLLSRALALASFVRAFAAWRLDGQSDRSIEEFSVTKARVRWPLFVDSSVIFNKHGPDMTRFFFMADAGAAQYSLWVYECLWYLWMLVVSQIYLWFDSYVAVWCFLAGPTRKALITLLSFSFASLARIYEMQCDVISCIDSQRMSKDWWKDEGPRYGNKDKETQTHKTQKFQGGWRVQLQVSGMTCKDKLPNECWLWSSHWPKTADTDGMKSQRFLESQVSRFHQLSMREKQAKRIKTLQNGIMFIPSYTFWLGWLMHQLLSQLLFGDVWLFTLRPARLAMEPTVPRHFKPSSGCGMAG